MILQKDKIGMNCDIMPILLYIGETSLQRPREFELLGSKNFGKFANWDKLNWVFVIIQS